jgi:hypothetical protein
LKSELPQLPAFPAVDFSKKQYGVLKKFSSGISAREQMVSQIKIHMGF